MRTIYHLPLDLSVTNYDWLVNGAAQTKVDTYLGEEHTFNENTEVKPLLVALHLRSLAMTSPLCV